VKRTRPSALAGCSDPGETVTTVLSASRLYDTLTPPVTFSSVWTLPGAVGTV